MAKSLLAIRKDQLSKVLPRLTEWWRTAKPGEQVYVAPTDKWWACAAPPWMTILDNLDDTDVEPKHPRKWLKSMGVPLERPGYRAKAETKERYELGVTLLASVAKRFAEQPPLDPDDFAFVMINDAIARKLDVAIDLETTGLDAEECDIVGVGIATSDGSGTVRKAYFPFTDRIGWALSYLNEAGLQVIGWNSLFDQRFLNNHGFDLVFTDDAKITAWLTNVATILHLPTGGAEGRAPSLKEAATAILGVHGVPFSKMLKAYDAEDIRSVPWIAQEFYGANDAEWTLRLFYYLESLMQDKARYPQAEKVYREEIELFPVVAQMYKGIRLDRECLKRHRDEQIEIRDGLHYTLLADYGLDMEAASKEEISAAVYADTPPTQFTAAKQEPALNKAALADLDTPLSRLLLERSACTKLLNAFYDPLWESGADRVKPDWRSFGTWSGRFSCSNPNIQQQPEVLRDMYVPDQEDHCLVAADYGQAELRVAAFVTNEQRMIDILNDPERSLHTEVMEMFGLTVKQRAKNLNFGAIYGGEKDTLSRQSGIPVEEAAGLIASHKREFPDLYRERAAWIVDCRKRGRTITLGGLVRLLPDLMSRDRKRRGEAEREAFNHLVQGTVAGIIKKCMREMYAVTLRMADLEPRWLECRLLLQNHDELVYSVPVAIAQDFMTLLQQTGETDFLDPVKLVFEPSMGFNWKETHGA